MMARKAARAEECDDELGIEERDRAEDVCSATREHRTMLKEKSRGSSARQRSSCRSGHRQLARNRCSRWRVPFQTTICAARSRGAAPSRTIRPAVLHAEPHLQAVATTRCGGASCDLGTASISPDLAVDGGRNRSLFARSSGNSSSCLPLRFTTTGEDHEAGFLAALVRAGERGSTICEWSSTRDSGFGMVRGRGIADAGYRREGSRGSGDVPTVRPRIVRPSLCRFARSSGGRQGLDQVDAGFARRLQNGRERRPKRQT